MSIRLDFLIGCTACGKGAVARQVARRLGAEIVSVDSMKVYRRMDIGTGKPTPAERAAVPHHLIDIIEPSESFSVARYVTLADAAVCDIASRGRPILVVGGTALYIKGLAKGLFEGAPADPDFRAAVRRRAEREGTPALHAELATKDPEAAARIHPHDLRRIERALEVHAVAGRPISQLQTQWESADDRYECRLFGLRRDRPDQSGRINRRVVRMIEAGLVEEARRLLAEPVPLSQQAAQAVGYAEIIEHLQGLCSLEDAVEAIKINTRHFAKSQRTWFRRFGDVAWLDVGPDEAVEQTADRLLAAMDSP